MMDQYQDGPGEVLAILKSPVGIGAILIVLLYATAGFVSSSNQWTNAQRWLLSVFLFAYPFVVLGMAFVLLTRDGKK